MAKRGPKFGHLVNEATREKIQVTKLVQLLEADAFGDIVLTEGRRASIKILLGKCLPDLSNVQVSGDKDRPLALTVTWQK